MDLYEKIKELAAQRKLSIRRLEEELGFANGSLKQWKTSNPGADKLTKVADYFHVSVDYLLGREEKPFPSDADLTELIDKSTHFDGREYPDEVKQGMKDVLRAYLMGRLDDKE